MSAGPCSTRRTTPRPAGPTTTRGVVLVIFKEPGANIIDTVDEIKAELPMLTASMPASLKLQVLSDRTQTIRASVADVQFTLMLTIGMVVMVIFLFLRNVWATAIPAFTVPLALLGTCALMWSAGYSIDNLSLMALTISIGFVVDDAIVMLENICPLHRARREADGCRDPRRRRDRLHHHVDRDFAGGRADPAALDGRHHRPPVQGVRGDAGHDHPGFGLRFADADADAGFAFHQARQRGTSRQALPVERKRLRRHAARL